MKRDANTELSTLPELVEERNKLVPKIEDNTATVREAMRFSKLCSLISMFNNAKSQCSGLRNFKKKQVEQTSKKIDSIDRHKLANPVIRHESVAQS